MQRLLTELTICIDLFLNAPRKRERRMGLLVLAVAD